MYVGSAAAVVLVLCVLLESGTTGVSGNCDPGESNYTTIVTVNTTQRVPGRETKIVKTKSCDFLRWFCDIVYKADYYYVMKDTLVQDKITKEECCPGYFVANSSLCIQSGCLNGTYGENCTQTCFCPDNAFENCDQENGNCMCLPGWHGSNCTEVCDPGHYGEECQSNCECEDRATCDPHTGQCSCPPGWDGHFCEKECANETYGYSCNETCLCTPTQMCDHVTGNCDTCKSGISNPPVCDKLCPQWSFGQHCSQNCSCDTSNTVYCHVRTGKCTCHNGYRGLDCEHECSPRTYGFECRKRCDDKCKSGFCNQVNGSCYNCYGKTGPNCSEECPGDTFGFDCLSQCKCNSNHSNGTCDSCSGACHCHTDWTGYTCDIECPAYMVDTSCQSMVLDNHCEPFNITWSCSDGWTGKYCDKVCDAGRYGNNCSSNCTCNSNQDCNPVTGHCTCKPGYTRDYCTAALHATQDDEAVGMMVYILAAGGAVLLAACVLAVVCLTRRKHREPNKAVFRDSHTELETRDTEQHTMNDSVDSAEGLTQMLQQESGGRGNITNALVSACEYAEETSIDTPPGATLYLHKGLIDEDASYTSEHLYEEDEHYADVDNEENTSVKPLPKDTLVIDDEHNSDYDTSESLIKNVIKTDKTFDKFENLTSQSEDYDVITRPGIVPMPLASNENYCTFKHVRQQSKKGDKVSNTDESRVSDSYDNLEYRNRKEQCLNFDTSLYNMGNEFSLSQNNEATIYRTSNAVPNPHITKNSELTAFNNENKRLSENIYEECPEEIDKTNDEELKEENNQPAIEEYYERLSAAQNDAYFDKKTDEIENDIPNDEMDHQPCIFEKDKQISDGLYEDCLDDNIGRSNSAEKECGNSDQAELYEKVSDNDSEEDQTDPDSLRISGIKSYENYKLPLESHEQEHSRPNDQTREVESNAQSTSNPIKDNVQTLKSKERRAVDYEQFQFKMK